MFGLFKKKLDPEEEYLADLEQRRQEATGMGGTGSFRMTVEDVFTISGRGTVVVGNVEVGSVSVGDNIWISGSSGRRSVQVEGLELFRKIVETAQAGDDVGVLLKGVSHDQVKKGDILLKG